MKRFGGYAVGEHGIEQIENNVTHTWLIWGVVGARGDDNTLGKRAVFQTQSYMHTQMRPC
eukprot:942709-Lingulodinium_polyedra.AAC.1